MRKIVTNLVLLVLSSLMLQGAVTDISKYTVGRVRNVEGESAEFTFMKKKLKLDFDYLVMLSATFETKKGRLEVVDLNNDIFWFDRETFFNFESYDTVGQRTTMFLGKGSFACKTKKPFSVITSSGSILFPANGRYVLEKPEFGKTETIITVIEGTKPTIIKKSGIFSKFNFEESNSRSGIYKWMLMKEADWKKTIVRTKLFSNAARMSPYIANTNGNGKVSWVKMRFIKPLYTADSMIDGNSFYYFNEDILRASGIAPDLVNKFNENELRLWFLTNKYNAIKWSWSVIKGWHTELYYDPLVNFGAEYKYSYSFLLSDWRFLRGPSVMTKFMLNPDYYNYLPVRKDRYDSMRDILTSTLIRAHVKPVRGTVKVVKHVAIRTRMNTDMTLVKSKNADKLGISLRDVKRAEVKQQHNPGRRGAFSIYSGAGRPTAQVRPRGTGSYYSSRVVGKVSGSSKK